MGRYRKPLELKESVTVSVAAERAHPEKEVSQRCQGNLSRTEERDPTKEEL